MKPADLDVILEVFNDNHYKAMLNNIPCNKFFSIQHWPFVQKTLHKYMIVMFYRKLLIHSDITVDTTKSFTMQIGSLHHLSSGNLNVGYLVELPKKIKLTVGNSTIITMIGKNNQSPQIISDVPNAQHDFINKHLSIYMQNTSQLIACHTDIINFLS